MINALNGWETKLHFKNNISDIINLCFSFKSYVVLKFKTTLPYREGLEVTDDVSIVEHLKHPVYITEGSYTNIKVVKFPILYFLIFRSKMVDYFSSTLACNLQVSQPRACKEIHSNLKGSIILFELHINSNNSFAGHNPR